MKVVITCLFFLQLQTLLHAAPPIEPCPKDSIQVEDTCKCNPSFCTKPPCPYDLTIASNGTEIPGNCCTIYSCEGCPNSTTIDGKCPCAPGAILNSVGECKCTDPHKILTNNECICDKKLCELPPLCDVNYVSVTVEHGCCSKTKCIKCPDDSFVTNNNDDAVEDKCVCYPCTDKECGPNEKVVIMQRGNSFPGTCCDMYKCEKNNSKCVDGDVVHEDGDVWEVPDGHMCKCQRGISFCNNNEDKLRECHKEGTVYKHGESWQEDICSNCTCFDGEIKCIAHMCEGHGIVKHPVCPPFNCTKPCPNGYKYKKGCQTCKCNIPNKYGDILLKYNITKNELEDILDDYFAQNKSTVMLLSPTTDVANASDQFLDTTPVSELEACQPLNALQWSAVGLSICAALMSAIFIMRWLSRRKKGSYDTNPTKSTIYERMNLTKDALCNNNYIGNENKEKKASRVVYS